MTRFAAAAVLVSAAAFAGEPVIDPAGEAARSAEDAKRPRPTEPAPANQTVVSDKRVWADAELVGKSRQPFWTTQRSFTGPRVYVAPPGAVTAEFWVEARVPFDGSDSRLRTLYELSIGLPFRLQLDLYLRLEHTGLEPVKLESERVELRWALANWDVIPWNPTLYLEWIRQTEGPQKLEAKLLLGSNITERWTWGGNFFWERELWGTNLTNEYGLTGSVSYSVLERTLSIGGGYRIEFVDFRDERFKPRSIEFLVGPTLSARPLEGLNILVGLFCGPALEREDVTGPFNAKFVFQPTLVGGWRF